MAGNKHEGNGGWEGETVRYGHSLNGNSHIIPRLTPIENTQSQNTQKSPSHIPEQSTPSRLAANSAGEPTPPNSAGGGVFFRRNILAPRSSNILAH